MDGAFLRPVMACPTSVFCTLDGRICTKKGGWAASGQRGHVQPRFFVHLTAGSVQKNEVGTDRSNKPSFTEQRTVDVKLPGKPPFTEQRTVWR